MQNNKGKNIIVELSFGFALKIISYAELPEKKQKYIIARQLLKSGTSIGANVREAQNAESKNDFIHKLKIAAKEQMKRNIGCYYAKTPLIMSLVMIYWKIVRI